MVVKAKRHQGVHTGSNFFEKMQKKPGFISKNVVPFEKQFAKIAALDLIIPNFFLLYLTYCSLHYTAYLEGSLKFKK